MRTSERSPETTHRTVTVRCTGRVRDAVGKATFEYSFEGETLGEFLAAFFEDYAVADLLLATEESSESAPGWVNAPDSLPGTWRRNPEGERVRRYARVLVNGTFNEHLEGFDTLLSDGDRVALMYPFVYCV